MFIMNDLNRIKQKRFIINDRKTLIEAWIIGETLNEINSKLDAINTSSSNGASPAPKESDIEIIETHHNRKIDSPSGTAILLANAINEVFNGEKQYNFDRMSKREKREKKEIGFSSIRGGNIVGEHTVQFFSENETLEITHKSYSRQVFAEGALKAANFIVNQENGLYDMKNLVNN